MDQKRENDLLLQNFLEWTFFKEWRNPGNNLNFRAIELMINSTCDLACQYCYYTNFGHELYPSKISKPNEILENLHALLTWLVDNKFRPEIDLFSGELFAQKIGRDVLNLIYDFYSKVPWNLRPRLILIPTNYSFILDDNLIKYADDIIGKFRSIGINIGLSASVDGKYFDKINRPMRKVLKGHIEDPRDDEYYNKIFAFNKRHGFGFHPMVYSNGIEMWKDNFLWFQEMFDKYDIPWNYIYLLEVRNAEWTTEQIKEFGRFMQFLIDFAWEKCDKDFNKYFEFLTKGKGFNILSAPIGKIGRGLGCSIQSMMYIRLGDLTISPCHRTMYPGFQYARFKKLDGKIVGIESLNPELMIATFSLDAATFPYCQECLINDVCSKGCLGSQLEVTGDMFTPIPTVCQLEHVKVWAMADKYRQLGILSKLLAEIDRTKAKIFKKLLREYDNLLD